MPGVISNDDASRKRKRLDDSAKRSNGVKPRKAPKIAKSEDVANKIVELEHSVRDSPEQYKNLDKLQSYVAKTEDEPEAATLAAVSLCRAFCRMIANQILVRKKSDGAEAVQALQVLKKRYQSYLHSMVAWLDGEDEGRQSTALTLVMRLVKEEASQEAQRVDQAWRVSQGAFMTLVRALIVQSDAAGAREEFMEKYVEEHDDVRYYMFLAIKQVLSDANGLDSASYFNALHLLSRIEGVPDSEDQLEDWYGDAPESDTHALKSLSAHRRAAQEAWLSLFRSPITADHRKKILQVMTRQILPWFSSKLEILTDFLTDSFNSGGSNALLSLQGIFHLITKNNIDYPDFYAKLYSLLDDDVLHSKHRSRFFRLLDTFLASSHLPAALIASFIKRLARLSLQAPPGAIVWIVPWTYNILRQHPSCTFMLHRTPHPSHLIYSFNPSYPTEGMSDPFNATESDPMATRAIDSSLWEIQTLTTHYHPNVATLAKILGEQFTKREYGLEDFLDYTYVGLVEGDLGKGLKKPPVVEFEIPKRIVTNEEGGLNDLGGLLGRAMEMA
ncbi:Maturation and nuclear export of 40S ribosomal subunits interacting protein [Oleoguttula sp. CCFEE 5521]